MRYRLEVREGIMPVLLSEDYTYPSPELCKVQQIFDRTLLEDVEGTLKRAGEERDYGKDSSGRPGGGRWGAEELRTFSYCQHRD